MFDTTLEFLSRLMSEMQWVHTGLILLVASLFLYVLRSLNNSQWVWSLAWSTLAASCLAFGGAIFTRSMEAQYFALSNMYESMLILSMSMMLCFLVVDRWFKLPSLGWPVCLTLLATIGYAVTLPTEIHPLQAALQSYWRSIHVPVILTSYALFTLSFVTSILYLFRQGGQNKPNTPAVSDGPSLTASRDNTPSGGLLAMAKSLDGVDLYDEVTYRLIAVGFPLLAIGIILGGLWANEAWGNYWSWDPKESMSLVTLLAYGVYLHLRVNGEHSPRLLAWMSVAGFLMMLLTYFGVNIMGVGLHSYGKIG